jgi:hypothetical protein
MIVNLNSDEIRFLYNLILNRDACLPAFPIPNSLISSLRNHSEQLDLTSQEIGILQALLQEQAEVNGSRHSTANEKKFMGPGTTFIPNQTLVLVKNITDKLGAHLQIDTSTKSDQTTGRQEGSTWIITNPTLKHIG